MAHFGTANPRIACSAALNRRDTTGVGHGAPRDQQTAQLAQRQGDHPAAQFRVPSLPREEWDRYFSNPIGRHPNDQTEQEFVALRGRSSRTRSKSEQVSPTAGEHPGERVGHGSACCQSRRQSQETGTCVTGRTPESSPETAPKRPPFTNPDAQVDLARDDGTGKQGDRAAAVLAVAVENRAHGGPRLGRDLKHGTREATTVLDDDTRARLAGSFSCGVARPRIHADQAFRGESRCSTARQSGGDHTADGALLVPRGNQDADINVCGYHITPANRAGATAAGCAPPSVAEGDGARGGGSGGLLIGLARRAGQSSPGSGPG